MISAEDRGMEIMKMKWKEIPLEALEFSKYMCNKLGICSETLLTSWIVYAQCIEKLPCNNPLYKALLKDVEWFQKNYPI